MQRLQLPPRVSWYGYLQRARLSAVSDASSPLYDEQLQRGFNFQTILVGATVKEGANAGLKGAFNVDFASVRSRHSAHLTDSNEATAAIPVLVLQKP